MQVNYLGFPGTMGTDYMDVILADRHVIPPEHQRRATHRSTASPPGGEKEHWHPWGKFPAIRPARLNIPAHMVGNPFVAGVNRRLVNQVHATQSVICVSGRMRGAAHV